MTSATRKPATRSTDKSEAELRAAAAFSKAAKLRKLIAYGDKVVAARFRTKMCQHFVEKGSCPYESRCMFAHGPHQLRTKQENLRDGLVNEDAIRQFKRATPPRQAFERNDSERTAELETPTHTATPSSQRLSPRSSAPSPSASCEPEAWPLGSARAGTADADAVDAAASIPAEKALHRQTKPRVHWYRHNPYAWCALSPTSPSDSRA